MHGQNHFKVIMYNSQCCKKPNVKLLLHNEKPYDLYFSPNIVHLIKSGRIKWARNVVHMGERRDAYRVLVGKR
jgi:hypothetical protein